MKTIDVSAWNGAIDFIKVKKAGVGAVIIRAGYGSGHIDKRAHEYAKSAINAGLPIGLYWFSYAKSQQDARNEARAAVDFAKQYKISLPIYFDFEDDSAKFAKSEGVNVNKSFVTNVTLAFCETVRAAGYRAGWYANYNYYVNYYNPALLKDYSFWFAYWGNKIKSGISCDIWQYSASGKISGISGNVDCDLLYNESLITGVGPTKKTINELAAEVIAGKWGNGSERRRALESAGYDYKEVQARVDEIFAYNNEIDKIAREVIAGKWANGSARKSALTAAGYDYKAVQNRVNEILKR